MADRQDEFEELEEFIDDTLPLPIHGKTYVIPAVDGKTGVWAQKILAEIERAKDAGQADAGKLNDGDERILIERMLGPVLDEMVEDEVKWPRISHAGMTVFFWTVVDRAAAAKYWKSGGDPEALGSAAGQNRRSRRASEAAERTTRKRASTSGTKARKTSAKKSASRGAKS
ncbi:hypothetical protein GCM10010402_66100 [Actinomadura luteofluorescens]|uniref:DUF7426 family protein n=1 Tax=Actinomadura luteofluorescens TaxID=46163 RepID=UPI0021644EAE|nr:hypothetical protein [Actinomadura glauciflava]MCR3744218.1 hypothetical protein [Actinomadura glauciflava]